jgi:GT2 family glycosyltransferase
MKPLVSVVIPVRDQASRLRLTLSALARQSGVASEAYEIVVVDDGSSDDLQTVTSAAPATLRLSVVPSNSRGARGVPRNVGVQAARGDLIVFLDADACPGEHLLEQHLAAQSRSCLALGEIFVTPGTYTLADPSTGAVFARAQPDSRWPVLVFDEESWRDGVERFFLTHAIKGGYPDMSEWHLQIEEMLAAGGAMQWVGSVPHNLSIPRGDFLQLGGFDPALPFSEGWDFGLRAQRAGYPIRLASGARSFHLYHWRSHDRDVNNSGAARRALCARYPEQLPQSAWVWLAATSGSPAVPAELNLHDWRVLEAALSSGSGRRLLVDLGGSLERYSSVPPLMSYLDGGAINSPFRPFAP